MIKPERREHLGLGNSKNIRESVLVLGADRHETSSCGLAPFIKAFRLAFQVNRREVRLKRRWNVSPTMVQGIIYENNNPFNLYPLPSIAYTRRVRDS